MLGGQQFTERQGTRHLEDAQLARSAAQGDQDAFAILVGRYRRLVYAIAYKIVLDEEDALDVAQSVFLRLAAKIGKFRGEGSFRGWLSAITARMAIDYVRRRIRRREILAEPETLDHAPVSASPGSRDPRAVLERKMSVQLVERVIRDLAPQQRAIFVLRFREGMKPKEIAERLEIPGKQVRSQLHRALARIRRRMEEE